MGDIKLKVNYNIKNKYNGTNLSNDEIKNIFNEKLLNIILFIEEKSFDIK